MEGRRGGPEVPAWGCRARAVAFLEDGRRRGSRREGWTLKRFSLRPLQEPLLAQCLPPDLLGWELGFANPHIT